MEKIQVKVGMKVLFGRTNGEQTLGEIIKVNKVRLKVKQLESRGAMRSYPVGTTWTVTVGLCALADSPNTVLVMPERVFTKKEIDAQERRLEARGAQAEARWERQWESKHNR